MSRARGERAALALLVLALVAGPLGGLIGGLAWGATLRTGRLDPLDWSAPMLAGLALPAAWLRWRGAAPTRPVIATLVLAGTAPPLVLVALATSRWAWLPALAHGLVIGGSVCLFAALLALRARRSSRGLMPAGAAAMIAATLIQLADRPAVSGPPAGAAILSALPLHGARAAPGAAGVLDAALRPAIRLRPVDSLAGDALRGETALLVAQPAPLAPAELVALDAWVRNGGRAVILADPALLWEIDRPLGHPLAPPRETVLAPLLRHWGLSLAAAAAAGDPVVRHVWQGGALAQLAGPGLLSAQPPTAAATRCVIAEDGFLARCAIGKGSALVVADGDWINPDLWTRTAQRPDQRGEWTADTPDVLAGWLAGNLASPAMATGSGFLRDTGTLLAAIRLAAVAALSAAVLLGIAIRRRDSGQERANPTSAQKRRDTKEEQGGVPPPD